MIEQQWMVDADFVVPGLNNPNNAQPTNTDRAKFVSESSLDTAIATVHAAKDRPHLTMNDKVFAARYTVAVTYPRASQPIEHPDDDLEEDFEDDYSYDEEDEER